MMQFSAIKHYNHIYGGGLLGVDG